jgi:hypothetical protein
VKNRTADTPAARLATAEASTASDFIDGSKRPFFAPPGATGTGLTAGTVAVGAGTVSAGLPGSAERGTGGEPEPVFAESECPAASASFSPSFGSGGNDGIGTGSVRGFAATSTAIGSVIRDPRTCGQVTFIRRQHGSDGGIFGPPHSIHGPPDLIATRNRALRLRGLRANSSSAASTGFFVIGSHVPGERNACFTRRSSSE